MDGYIIAMPGSDLAQSARRKNLEEQVQGYRELISQYHHKVVHLSRQINGLLPVSRIPPELLAQVFSCYLSCCYEQEEVRVEGGEGTRMLRPTEWTDVLFVSSYWHSVAMTSPSLWTTIDTFNLAYSEACLARSQGAPLRVRYIEYLGYHGCPRRDDSPRVLLRVLREFSRITHLIIHVGPQRWPGGAPTLLPDEEMDFRVPTVPNMLRSLELVGHILERQQSFPLLPIYSSRVTTASQLELERLVIKDHGWHLPRGILAGLPSSLKHLTYHRPIELIRGEGALDPSSFHRLQDITGLESLHLIWVLPDYHWNFPGSLSTWGPITLANLTDLYICDDYNIIAYSLPFLNLPVLETIRIETQYLSESSESPGYWDRASLDIIWSTLNKHVRFTSATITSSELHFRRSIAPAVGHCLDDEPDPDSTSSFNISLGEGSSGLEPLLREACRAQWFDSIEEVYFRDDDDGSMEPGEMVDLVGSFGAVWRLVCYGPHVVQELWPLLGSSMTIGKITLTLPMLRELVFVTASKNGVSEGDHIWWKRNPVNWKKLAKVLRWRKESGMGVDYLVICDPVPGGCVDITKKDQLLLASEVKEFRFLKEFLVS